MTRHTAPLARPGKPTAMPPSGSHAPAWRDPRGASVRRAALAVTVAAFVAASAAPARADGIDLGSLRAAAQAGADAGGANAKRYAAVVRTIDRRDRPGLADDFAKMLAAARGVRGPLAGDTALSAALASCVDEGLDVALAGADAEACVAAASAMRRAVRRRIDGAMLRARAAWDAALAAREDERPDASCVSGVRAARDLATAARVARAEVARTDRGRARWTVVHSNLVNALWGVTVTSGADPTVFAVGTAVGGDALFLRGTQDGWVAIPGAGPDDLQWVAQIPGAGVWACGDRGRVVRYDPVTGVLADVPTGTTGKLWGLWGSGPDDVWIVGDLAGAPQHVLRHFDGASWSDVPAPAAADGRGLYKVWGCATDDVWACGGAGTLIHWDGATWTTVASPVATDLLTVTGSPASDEVVVVGAVIGATVIEGATSSPFALRYENAGLSAAGVFVPARGDAWAVGYAAAGNGTVLRRTRGRWAPVVGVPPLPYVDFHAVHVDDTGAVWIVGGRLGLRTEGAMLHYGPRAVSTEAPLVHADFATRVQPIFEASCTDACHAGIFAAEGLDLSSADATGASTRRRSTQSPLLRVLPGRPSGSYLWHKMAGTHLVVGGSGERMPQGADPLPAEDLDAVRAWILEGAPR